MARHDDFSLYGGNTKVPFKLSAINLKCEVVYREKKRDCILVQVAEEAKIMAVWGDDGILGNAHLVQALYYLHEKMETEGWGGTCPSSHSIQGWSSMPPLGTHCRAQQSQHSRGRFYLFIYFSQT